MKEVDSFLIDKILTDHELLEGPIFCEVDYFKFVYNLEKRISYRYNRNSIIMIITMRRKSQISYEQIESAAKNLKDILWHALRKSDLVTIWNENQIIVLLINIEEKHFKTVTKRIEQKFTDSNDNELFDIDITHRNIYKTQNVVR
ncbi:hypothetical protein [Natranaerofaba carboxydovora]|uniref:hypothetical protein n=1 Tax=Natranaerofaba carboxydovora TaxID=2742683 RepID=UPI001F13E16E|nr:hypothetical protein [Natranaerofaba carboxydovora]UMZ74817.1 hypothetical protein ACONDI_02420 [Natranaerofaba carboxydovora]